MSDLTAVQLIEDKINKHGRRELTLTANHRENILWDGKRYECVRCEKKFSFQEGVLQ